MNKIEDMLVGIAIMIFAISIHLFLEEQLLTDFIALIGFVIVLSRYFSKNNIDQIK